MYFQKRTKIVRAKPDDHYRVYSIPINSAIKFVPLHKEDAKFTKAAWEGDFDDVADVAKLKVLPLVSILIFIVCISGQALSSDSSVCVRTPYFATSVASGSTQRCHPNLRHPNVKCFASISLAVVPVHACYGSSCTCVHRVSKKQAPIGVTVGGAIGRREWKSLI